MFIKSLLPIALCLSLVLAGPADVVMKYFTTKTSHFGLAPGETFQMRYLIDDSYFLAKPKNGTEPLPRPILFYCGNEGDIYQFYQNSGFMTETLAEEWGGLVVFGEHRYFGGSWPFDNKAKAMYGSNKQFLTVDDVLMDYNELIKSIKAEYGAGEKAVIAFGGSYGGMLAAWMRMKYPQTIQGALAASAPILYFHGAQNMADDGAAFFDVITNDFKTVNEPKDGLCAEGIRQAFLEIPKLQANNATWSTLKADYNLCDEVTTSQDLQDLYDHISNGIAYMAMTDYPYASDFLTSMPPWPVNVSCSHGWGDWTNTTANQDQKILLTNLIKTADVYFNSAANPNYCVNFKDTGGTGSLDGDAWNVLQCNQLAMPNSTGDSSMFLKYSFDYEANTKSCNDQYGMSPDYLWAVREFGGAMIARDFAGYSNIIFSNGNLDPWIAGGVTEYIGLKNPYYIIQGGAHHLDLRLPNKVDIGTDVERVRNHEKLDLMQYIMDYQDQFTMGQGSAQKGRFIQ